MEKFELFDESGRLLKSIDFYAALTRNRQKNEIAEPVGSQVVESSVETVPITSED